MNNTEKLLMAFIEASGYKVESFTREAKTGEEPDVFLLDENYCIDYKVTKKRHDKELRLQVLKSEIEELLKSDEKD